ncbi:MAG: F0F1 ATP synthase subunit delta [Alphaproteobacteria bacterium]
MTSSSSNSSEPISSVVMTRYAGALIDLAEKGKSVQKVQKDFKDIESMIADTPELGEVISSPLVSQAKQEKIISDIASKAKLQKLTKNFLGVLVENRRLSILVGVIRAYNKIVSLRSGEVTVQVQTAQKMTVTQEKALNKKISSAIGSNVLVEAVVVPEILGGMIVTVGSYMVDDSVRRKLERLGASLKNNSNQNTVNLKEVV